MTVALMIELVTLVAGPGWRPTEVVLQSGGAPPADADTLLSGARVRVCGRATALVFPRVFLARPLPRSAEVPPPSSADVRDWLLLGPPDDFVASARVLVASLVEAERPGVDAAALAAGTSVRTFQRRLAAAGTSYSRLIDEVRLDGALRLLGDPAMKAVDVAYRLGYSDPAHFTRAFRRWTSLSPAGYRRLRCGGDRPSLGGTGRTS
jgi:AraC-like DNA-binding protein